jgi:hypothetical protein
VTTLTFEDYRNMITLAKQKNPLWDTSSRDHCIAASLVTKDGNLTPNGKRKALKLDYALDKLQNGCPLNRRAANRADELWLEKWAKVQVPGERYEYAVNNHALFMDREGIDLPGAYADESELKGLKTEIDIHLRTKAWYKLEPFAIQLDQVGGLECVCLRPVTTRGRIYRIQSKYFDFACRIYAHPTFWYRDPTEVSPNPPIAVKYDPQKLGAPRIRKGLKNGIVALIMPVAGSWPEPLGVCDE